MTTLPTRADRMRPALESVARRADGRLESNDPRTPATVSIRWTDGSVGTYRTESAAGAVAVALAARQQDPRAATLVRADGPGREVRGTYRAPRRAWSNGQRIGGAV